MSIEPSIDEAPARPRSFLKPLRVRDSIVKEHKATRVYFALERNVTFIIDDNYDNDIAEITEKMNDMSL
jgi:hypothetical protein